MNAIGKILLWLAGIAGCLFLAATVSFWWSMRAQELPVSSARTFITLEPGDEVLRAYTGVRWLDSERYFLIKADPAGFDDRIARLSNPARSRGGDPGSWEVRVTSGPGKELWSRRPDMPKWWDVETLPEVVAVDANSRRHNHSGELHVFAKDRGLIYVLDR